MTGPLTTTTRTSSSTRVATILCTVFPVLIVIGMIAFGALWCRHQRHSRRSGRVASTIVIEEEGLSGRYSKLEFFRPACVRWTDIFSNAGLPPRLYHSRHPPPPPASIPAEPAAAAAEPPSSSEYPPHRDRRIARLSELLLRHLEPVFPHPQQRSRSPGRRVGPSTKATESSSPPPFPSSSSSTSSPLYCAPPHERFIDEHRQIASGAEATGQAENVEQQEEEDGYRRGVATLKSNKLPRLPPPVYEP